jgi:hypothetical protein
MPYAISKIYFIICLDIVCNINKYEKIAFYQLIPIEQIPLENSILHAAINVKKRRARHQEELCKDTSHLL